MTVRNIRTIVAQFKKHSNDDRYHMLAELLDGYASNPVELTWRAKLCTALEKAHVYPHPIDEEEKK